jgi:ABC-type transport system involved in multi-copper enzyme maturation permease subunit
MRMAMGYINMETVPQFTMNRISLTQGLQAIWVDVLLLIIFNLLFFSIAYVGFLRYDVR